MILIVTNIKKNTISRPPLLYHIRASDLVADLAVRKAVIITQMTNDHDSDGIGNEDDHEHCNCTFPPAPPPSPQSHERPGQAAAEEMMMILMMMTKMLMLMMILMMVTKMFMLMMISNKMIIAMIIFKTCQWLLNWAR